MSDATEFLGPAKIHGAYYDCIQGAKKNLVMVMPWFTPSDQLRDALNGLLLRDDVCFTLVTRPPAEAKNKTHDKALSDLLGKQRRIGGQRKLLGLRKEEERDQIEVLLVKNVHAKTVIQDEATVVVSSSNLNTMSIARNTEFGILSREKTVVADALREIDALRNSDRAVSTASGAIRNCDCGGWIFEPGHDVCFSCYRKKSGVQDVVEVDEPDGDDEEEVSTEAAASAPKQKSAAEPDPTVCPQCGNKKAKNHPVCRDCYYAKKDNSSAGSDAVNDKTICPECGGKKAPFFPVCKACHEKKANG